MAARRAETGIGRAISNMSPITGVGIGYRALGHGCMGTARNGLYLALRSLKLLHLASPLALLLLDRFFLWFGVLTSLPCYDLQPVGKRISNTRHEPILGSESVATEQRRYRLSSPAAQIIQLSSHFYFCPTACIARPRLGVLDSRQPGGLPNRRRVALTQRC